MILKDIHDEIKLIATSNLYRFGANGDNRLMAAQCLIMNLSHQLDFGNYSIIQINRLQSKDKLPTVDKECMQLLHIQEALLYYSACYDTLLQIAYFGFHIANDFSTKEDYNKRLENCKWNLISTRLEKFKGEECIDKLIKLLKVHYQNGRTIISEIINNAKHRGGISVPSLNTYIPDIANCSGVTFEEKDGIYKFNVPDNFIVVQANWFYPYTKGISEYRDSLYLANKRIYCFFSQLLKLMNLTPESINDSNFKIPLNFDTYGTEQDK